MAGSATFYAHGKLMLSGAYFALYGAKVLAVPTQPGQRLTVTHLKDQKNLLHWQGKDHKGRTWLDVQINLNDLTLKGNSTGEEAGLLTVLTTLKDMRPELFTAERAWHMVTELEFNRSWGLGSSSTLVSLLAQWAQVDGIELNRESLGGSGYDVACATATGPILYQPGEPVQMAELDLPFKDRLVFVHLNRKQDTREAVQKFKDRGWHWETEAGLVTHITEALAQSAELDEWISLKREEEELIARATGLSKVQDLWFADFPGLVCSLGAWGGDFVLMLSHQPAEETIQYAHEKGFETALRWEEVVFQSKR